MSILYTVKVGHAYHVCLLTYAYVSDLAADLIVEYLRKQNRPYSATDISANLHNVVTKTNAAKLLKDLSDRGELEVKVSGIVNITQDSIQNFD